MKKSTIFSIIATTCGTVTIGYLAYKHYKSLKDFTVSDIAPEAKEINHYLNNLNEDEKIPMIGQQAYIPFNDKLAIAPIITSKEEATAVAHELGHREQFNAFKALKYIFTACSVASTIIVVKDKFFKPVKNKEKLLTAFAVFNLILEADAWRRSKHYLEKKKQSKWLRYTALSSYVFSTISIFLKLKNK